MVEQLRRLLLPALLLAGLTGTSVAQTAPNAHPCQDQSIPPEEAIAHCQDIVAANPADATAQYHLAVLHLRAGQPAKARALFVPLAEAGIAAAQLHLGTLLQAEGEVGQIEAAGWFYQAATQGDPEGQFVMGDIHAAGIGVVQDDAVAIAWFELAAAQEHTDAMYRLALAYRDGRGIDPDPAAATAWLLSAATAGHPPAMALHGHALATNPDNPQPAEGAKWLRQAADEGVTDAKLWLASIYLNNGGPRDEAIQLLTEAATAGQAEAQTWLGLLLAETDPEAAIPWLERAANAGDAEAAFRRAALAIVANDPATARRWSEAAVAQDHSPAMLLLGRLLAASPEEADQQDAVTVLRRALQQGEADAGPLLASLDTVHAARTGDTAAQYALAKDSTRNAADRRDWLRTAASGGHIPAQLQLAALLRTAGDTDAAIRWLTAAAEQDSVDAQRRLGDIYSDATSAPTDQRLAKQWFARAAINGDTESGYHLSRSYYDGETAGIAAENARKWLIAAAEAGNIEAQSLLGHLHRDGREVPADQQAAARWLSRAAEGGDAAAQFALADMARAGEARIAVPVVDLLRTAAAQGHLDAQYELGRALEDGDLLPPDDTAAANWYINAANEGHAEAQYRLARLYGEGRGVGQDFDAALRWFTAAADQGLAPAATDIGVLYQLGWGVPRNLDTARHWYEKAAAKGDSRALRNLANLNPARPSAPATLSILPAEGARPGSRW